MIQIVSDHNRCTDAEILMAGFRELDTLAGEFRSPDAQSRVLVNKPRSETT